MRRAEARADRCRPDPSSGMPCGNAERAGRRATQARAAHSSSPAITASAMAQSATLRAIGPIESSVNDSGNAPSVGTRCWLGLKPTMPQSAAGMRHRAAGVGADGDLAHAVGDRDRAARGRAARHARAVGRIARRAEMRIGADAGEGEFGHVGLGDDHRAGCAQPAHDRRVGAGRRASSASTCEPARVELAGDVEQILDADDRAVERPEANARLRARIGGLGGGARGCRDRR